ncbi:MAG: HDOD domain-containing protein [Planctomycetota bacterium]|jgi:HD-like signal output (HDOD) protein
MGEDAGSTHLSDGDIKRFISSIDNLPTLPVVVAHVNELVENPSASATDINNAIRQDVALSARILKLVNSSFYGFPRKISSITHAVVILGFNTVRNVVLSAFVLDAFTGKGLPFGHRQFWIHSLGAGVAAQTLAEGNDLAEAEDAFIAGLLHDVGKIVMHQYARRPFAEVLRIVKERDCLIYDAEREVLGTTHAEVGGALLEAWHLPTHLVEAVRVHHAPEQSTQSAGLAAVVHIADILTRALLVGNGGDARIPRASRDAWARIGAPVGEVGTLCREIARDIRKVDAFVEML